MMEQEGDLIMKRIVITTILVLMLSLSVTGSVFAQRGKVNINGQVTEVGDGTITVLSNKGETFVVSLPAGFEPSSIKQGDSVLVKAVLGDGDKWVAQSIKLLGQGNDDVDEAENETDDDELAEGSKLNSAYCADGKQEKPHPLAARMAERFDVTEQWVMGYFCDGYGMGAIMLALKTSQIDGIAADPDFLLDERANGVGWGNIWKNIGLIGSEREGHSPPGLLKKPDHAGPKN